jgi:hypothetical protein
LLEGRAAEGLDAPAGESQGLLDVPLGHAIGAHLLLDAIKVLSLDRSRRRRDEDDKGNVSRQRGGQRTDPTALADAPEADVLLVDVGSAAEELDGREGFLRPVVKTLLGPVPGRGAHAGLVPRKGSNPLTSEVLPERRMQRPVIPAQGAGAVDEGDGRMRPRRSRQDEGPFEGIVPAAKRHLLR